MNKSRFFMIASVIVSLGELVSVLLNSQAHYIFKPLIVLMLVGYYLSATPNRNMAFMRALFFCWVGDFLLMFTGKGELYFILGLVAFLIGHVFYIFSFRQAVWQEPGTLLATQKVRYALPIFLAGTGLITVLYPVLGGLKVPVIIYSIVLMLMVSSALFRMGRTSRSSFSWIFIGALFFMISDSLLAINKFYNPFYLASLTVMTTYIIAQSMIVKGMLLHVKTPA